MKSRAAIWTLSGLFFAAIMVAVLGLTAASAKDQTAQKNRVKSLSEEAISSNVNLSKNAGDKRNNERQTLRVFWPIWKGRR
jgi:hypothetical protein